MNLLCNIQCFNFSLLYICTPSFLFKKFYFLTLLGLRCCAGLSLAVISRGLSLVAVHRLLISVAPLAEQHGLQGTWVSIVAASGF